MGMKRKTNSKKRKTKQQDIKAKIDAMQWIQSEASESNLIIDDQRDELMMYRTGRKSFGDFNVAVQKMEQESLQIIKEQTSEHQANETQSSSKSKSNKKKRKLEETIIDKETTENGAKRQKLSGNAN